MGKEEGEEAGRHDDNSSFVSILVCLFLFLSFSFSLFVRFLFLLQLRKQLYYGWNIVSHYLFVTAFVRSTYIYCAIISAPAYREKLSRPLQ